MLFQPFLPANIWNTYYILLNLLFLVIALATNMSDSSLVDEGTVQPIKLQHSWKEQLSCSCSVDEDMDPPVKMWLPL